MFFPFTGLSIVLRLWTETLYLCAGGDVHFNCDCAIVIYFFPKNLLEQVKRIVGLNFSGYKVTRYREDNLLRG